MRRIVLLTLSLTVLLALTSCMQQPALVVKSIAPESGHGATSVTIEVADMGSGWSYRLEYEGTSTTQAGRVFNITVYPPATLFVSGIDSDLTTTPATQVDILLENTAPIGYDPFGPLATFLVPGQMYVVDCNYHEYTAGFAWTTPIKTGFVDPEGDPWKITNVECWYEVDGQRINDPVFTPPLSPGEVEYHVGTPLVPALGKRIDNAFIIWPVVAQWVYDGNGVAIPLLPLPGYTPPCNSYQMHGGYISPETIYHVEIWTEDVYGDVGYLHVQKQLTGRAECKVFDPTGVLTQREVW